ncbi:hypothetical protein G7047_15590 [Diaphorobacter sp. HDW4A]|uniref:hypothetical protein n=1 Tax=Diaphorobacter sp. HDW4A TaxID=2714924 RepID=UPI0014096583|nr:hypothetical protein [Diaphorobacter sp. HDW4A]QIL81168.1 hypothetical protein G7047_15590 [Diaphorobacter sp. HDW4A]
MKKQHFDDGMSRNQVATAVGMFLIGVSFLAGANAQSLVNSDEAVEQITTTSVVQDAKVSDTVAFKGEDSTEVDGEAVDLQDWTPTTEQQLAIQNESDIYAFNRESIDTNSRDKIKKKLKWKKSKNGGEIATIKIKSGGATSLRVGMVIDTLPAGALVRTYPTGKRSQAQQNYAQQILGTLEVNKAAGDLTEAGSTWWTPSVDSDKVTLEIELPKGIDSGDVSFKIGKIAHAFKSVSSVVSDEGTAYGANANAVTCNLDANFSTATSNIKKSVVALQTLNSSGVSWRYCTANLITDVGGNKVPYIVTANHCVSDQTQATATEVLWFYNQTYCNSKVAATPTITKNGARLLYTQNAGDGTLLRLNDDPPSGAVYAGWTTVPPSVNSTVVGVHHPSGAVQEYFQGTLAGTRTCSVSGASNNCDTLSTSMTAGTSFQVTDPMGRGFSVVVAALVFTTIIN